MFIFFHLPKTAGSTFTHKLSIELSAKKALSFVSPAALAFANDKQLNQADLLSGHFGVSILNRINVPYRSCAIFRSPVQRVVSQYKWICHLSKTSILESAGIGAGVMFKDYIDPEFRPTANTDNLKRIFIDMKRKPILEGPFKNLQTWTFVSDPILFMRDRKKSDDELLESARTNILKLDSFGITEEIEKTFILFNRVFNFNLTNDVFLGSSEDIKLNIDKELIDLVQENNKLDVRLYEWVKDEFLKRYNELQDEANKRITANAVGITGKNHHTSISLLALKKWLLKTTCKSTNGLK